MVEKLPLGCFGNKKRECKKYFLDIIKNNIDDDYIFVEPFCGSASVSYLVYNNTKIKQFHINDLDKLRIDFYNNMKDEDKRNELYKIENDILEKGQEEYDKYVDKTKLKTDYWSYVIGGRIYSFRNGLFPTTKKIIIKPIPDKWIEFFNISKITNQDWKEIMEEYKDNEKAFIYLDPPYLSSFNGSYTQYNTSIDENKFIIDNTKIYIDILDFLKNSKCKILFSINNNAITRHLYKDYIKQDYLKSYDTTQIRKNDENKAFTKNKENILLISNF
jgi:site-specific DNA-adenine methylase